jgi:protein phosphatase
VDEANKELKETLGRHPFHLETCGQSDVGLRRPHNEDTIEVNDALHLYVVADGMGGHAAGEVASRTAVDAMREFIDHAQTDKDFTWPFGFDNALSTPENLLSSAIQLANRRVCQLAGENRDYNGMGTTLTALYEADDQILIGHVGDSRTYRLRGGQLELITNDHSWVNEQLQRNIITEDEARHHRWRNVITRALGNRPDLEVDLKSLEPQEGDLFLLCSDGLSGLVGDEEITRILSEASDPLEGACQALIEAANREGGIDNISVILVRVQP